MKKILIASNNLKKIKEIKFFLKSLNIKIYSQKDFKIPSIKETGLSFYENAFIKAQYLSQITGYPTIADDSGLVIKSLNGKPGILSSRYSGKDANDKKNISKILLKLKNIKNRTAKFVCVLVFILKKNIKPMTFKGICNGIITLSSKGNNGFGYDPIFYVSKINKTFAEMTKKEKNFFSHRSQAFSLFLRSLKHYV